MPESLNGEIGLTFVLLYRPPTATAAVLVSFTLLQYAGKTTDSYGVHYLLPFSLESERWSTIIVTALGLKGDNPSHPDIRL